MLSREEMVARMLGADPTADGQFIVAVRTTGIYCLPSCRPSRKPKPENVTFYPTPTEARAAGFRPCKLCKPDDFYTGHHAEELLIEELVSRVRQDPGNYPNVAALAPAIGVGTSKLHALLRTYYHTTPATLLNRARIAAAQRALLTESRAVAEIAFAVGYENLSTFNDNFRKYSAMAPHDYRLLREQSTFTLILPTDYPLRQILPYLGRDRQSLTEQVCDQRYTTVLAVENPPAEPIAVGIAVTFASGVAHCQITALSTLTSAAKAQLHTQLLRILGLTHHPARFEAQVSSIPDLAPLVAGQHGLRVPLIADPFDALVWAITGQQITLAFTYTLRRRLIERVGEQAINGLYAPPTATALATLLPAELIALGFSRAKAAYLIGIAQAVSNGALPLPTFVNQSALQIERRLLAIRGIGPWSAHYVLMRHYGFLNCVPVGDAVLTAGLQRFFALNIRPTPRETLQLMARFSPYQSLATFHFWQRQGTAA